MHIVHRWLGSGEGSLHEALVERLIRLVDCPRPEVLLKVGLCPLFLKNSGIHTFVLVPHTTSPFSKPCKWLVAGNTVRGIVQMVVSSSTRSLSYKLFSPGLVVTASEGSCAAWFSVTICTAGFVY